MAETHTVYSSLKKLLFSLNGLVACFLLLFIIFLVEIVVATGILVFFPIVQGMAQEHILATLRKNYGGYNEPGDFSTEWNLVMEKLKCCGVNNYTDFSGTTFEITTGHTYPKSCCKSIENPACDGRNVSNEIIHQEGCFPKLLRISKIQSFTLSGGSLGAALLQLPGILSTLLLIAKLA
ncbi:tetraspanin-16 isoform X2 [Tamandua tetradactyla]|uniref:tetraspanin-16 isoform X2 n=1 Tax=Tamandua tetradactyla TaxID=48850 RepID=UPI004053CD6D